jgi:hypothetical protein
MTLDEKIGQMTQAEQNALVDISDIEKYFLGSLLSGGSSDPKAGNSLEAWTDMYDGYQQRALKTRLGIPILFGVDAVHGHNNVLGGGRLPAQHWPRVYTKSGTGRRRGAHHRRRSSGHRNQLEFCSLHRSSSRRAMGQDLRRVWGDA